MNNLAESHWKEIRDGDIRVAVLPWGATEAHNYHLPYSTDNILAEGVASAAIKISNEAKAGVTMLPLVPFGVNTGQFDIKLCMNMNPSTQLTLLKDIVHVLNVQKIDKLVIINGHGANNFKPIIRELYQYYPDVFVTSIDWWKACDAKQYFDEPGDHAGELETSVVMHLRPDLVKPLEEAGDGSSNPYKIEALNEGWIISQRKWIDATNDTGVGNPFKSTPEKGKKFFDDVVEKISKYFIDLAKSDVKDLYKK